MNVYEASMERIALLFKEYDNVLVSFSGGKDSGIALNLCYDYAKKNGLLHKLAIYHLDYEAQYSHTTNYVSETFERLYNIRRFWLCLPVAANCGCKLDSSVWIPWNKNDKEVWCRDIPYLPYVINEENCPFPVEVGKKDYSVQDDFCEWFSNEYGKTAVVIGIRADESYERQSLIRYCGWITGQSSNYHKAYPIYDWKSQDVWIANGRFGWTYNQLYDLFYKAGLPLRQMRVANPFHNCGLENLKLYRVIEPDVWGKLLNRINGVNFGAMYGGTNAMGHKNLVKPEKFTWEQYAQFLIETSPSKVYKEKIPKWVAKWKSQGYADGLPDEADIQMENKRAVPSWRRVCRCILNNDLTLKGLGFSQPKCESYSMIKRITLSGGKLNVKPEGKELYFDL